MASGVDFAHLATSMNLAYPSTINGQEILEEDYNEDFEPTDEDVIEYCDQLGLDPDKESDLLYIAKEAIKAPLPPEWKPCKNEADEIYYFNFQTGESSWEHPCDKYYVDLLERERAKKRIQGNSGSKKKGSVNASSAAIKPLTATAIKAQLPADLPALSGRKGSLNPISNLPPLRSGGALGPLKPPLGMDTAYSKPANLATGAGGLSTNSPLKMASGKLGTQLGAPTRSMLNPDKEINVGISTNYEEEYDDDDSDEELSDGKDLLGANGYHSKFGNIMDAGDLGINLSGSDGEEDVSAELRGLQQFSSNDDSSDEFHLIDKTGGTGNLAPVLHGKSTVGSTKALRSATTEPQQQQHMESSPSMKRFQRPTAARGHRTQNKPQSPKEHSDSLSSESSLGKSRLPESVNLVELGDEAEGEIQATTKLFHQSHNLNLKPAGRHCISLPTAAARALNTTTNTAITTTTTTTVAATAISSVSVQATQNVQQSQEQEIAMMKKQHEEEMAKLRKSMEEEMVREKEKFRTQMDTRLAAFKDELQVKQIAEKKQLETEQIAHLTQFRDKLKEKQDEDEAKLQEEKSDFLRTLKQQVTRERQESEDKMRKDLEVQLGELRHQLELQKVEEEEAAKKDLEDLKKTLQHSRQEELRSNETEFEQQLAVVNDSHQTKLEQAKQELEAEYTRMMAETKTNLEKDHQKAMTEVETQYKTIRATEEEKIKHQHSLQSMEEDMEAELATKKTEIEQLHQQQLDDLTAELEEKLSVLQQDHQQQEAKERDAFSNKLDQLRKQLEMDNNAQLESQRTKLQVVQQDVQSQISKMEEELSNKKKQVEQEQLVTEKLLGTVESEKQAVETQRQNLEEKKKELAKEEQRVQQLRNATAAEADQLLAKQQSELKDDIEQEQKVLAELRKRKEQLQAEINSLSKEKSNLEAVIKDLKQQELACHQELETVRSQIEEAKESLSLTRDELKNAREQLQTQLDNTIKLSSTNKEGVGKVAAAAASLQELSASQESEDTLRSSSSGGHSSVSMSVHELASPSLNTDEVVDEAVSNKVKVAWEEKSKSSPIQSNSISQVQLQLISETNQLKQAQEFLQKQKQSIKKRRADLMQAQKSWTADQKKLNKRSSATAPSHRSIAQQVQKKFDKEAADISTTEDQLLLSNRLLLMKEQHLTQLEDSITSDVDSSSINSLPSSKSYPKVIHSRHHVDMNYRRHYKADSQSPERLRPSLLTSETEEDIGVMHKQAWRHKKHKLHEKLEDHRQMSSGQDDLVASTQIMNSLSQINSQLGEVLTKLGQPTPTTTYPSNDPLLQMRIPDRTEEELHRKWQQYLGHTSQQPPTYVPDIRSPYSFASPSDNNFSVRRSTAEMLKSQTDWLKTFQQEMSTFNRLTVKSRPSSLTASNSRNLTTLLSPAPLKTPKFVLDTRNNIHFVHV